MGFAVIRLGGMVGGRCEGAVRGLGDMLLQIFDDCSFVVMERGYNSMLCFGRCRVFPVPSSRQTALESQSFGMLLYIPSYSECLGLEVSVN